MILRKTAIPSAILAALIYGGCAWAKKKPVLRWFFPKPVPVHAAKKFSCEYPKKWTRRAFPEGAEFKDPAGRASLSVFYVPKGHKEYKPPELYRQYMASWGAVEDPHRLEEVLLSTWTAHRARFTTYRYDPGSLLGEKVEVYLSEVTMSPDREGLFIVRYHAPRDDFWRKSYRRAYERLLKSLTLVEAPPPPPPEPREESDDLGPFVPF